MIDEYNLVTEEMSRIEDLVEKDIVLALKEMISLYFRASKVCNHEVCDAINLWIYELKNPIIVEYLNEKIKENNAKNTQFQKWIGQSIK